MRILLDFYIHSNLRKSAGYKRNLLWSLCNLFVGKLLYKSVLCMLYHGMDQDFILQLHSYQFMSVSPLHWDIHRMKLIKKNKNKNF